MDYEKKFLFVTLYFTLLSCGGSIEKVEDYSLYDLTSPDSSNLELITVDGNTLSLSKASGLYVRDQGAASVVLSGTENSTNEIIQVDIPDKKITSFVTIIPEGNLINQAFGVLGLRDVSDPFPMGSFTYLGNAEVFINDGVALYGLNGSSTINLDYDGSDSKITGEITSLSGQKSVLDLSCRDCPVTQVVDIVIPSGSVCDNGRICLNQINLINSQLASELTSNYNLESDGALFGPEGSEIGGVFSVSDTDVGTIEIRGAFVGKRD